MMKFSLVLLVTFIETVQSLQGAERLLTETDPFAALNNMLTYNLTDSTCVFNFTDLISDEIRCTANITAPTAGVTVSTFLRGGNCTDMSIEADDNLVSNAYRVGDQVITTVQFLTIPVPPVQGDIHTTEMCVRTNVKYEGIHMIWMKKPIKVEFQYDGSFTITTAVAQNDAIGDKAEDKTVFTANAFVCDPDFTPSSKILTIGSILYVCVRPAEDQLTTMISSVKYFDLSKVGETPYFAVVKLDPEGSQTGTNSAVTVVTGETTRKVIIGCRVPSQFYDTATNITGTGEVILGQLRRLLRSDIALPRFLDEDAEEAEEDGSFDLDVKLETRGALSGSVLSSASSKTNLSVVVVLLSALYCFD